MLHPQALHTGLPLPAATGGTRADSRGPVLRALIGGLLRIGFGSLALLLSGAAGAAGLEERTWTVAGVERTARLHLPEASPAALVLVFHGHGGSAEQAARSFRIHELWPEALVVYPQGLPTPGKLTDPEGRRSGWQKDVGDQNDRDLRFIDTLVSSLRNERAIPPGAIFATGHSNGGSFTYLLWAARPDLLAACAPSAAVHSKKGPKLTPLPVLHLAGKEDDLVDYAWQEQMIRYLLLLNQADPLAIPQADGTRLHASRIDAPVVTYLHSGGHRFPKEGGPILVNFLKSCLPTD